MLEQEAVRLYGDMPARTTEAGIARLTGEVRRHGLARAVGRPIPGINAWSAPIFDFNGRLVLALTSLGPSGTFDTSWNGSLGRAVRDAADDVSRRLGYVPA